MYEDVKIDTDIYECSHLDTCPENSVCHNSAGNYTCKCNTGFHGNLCTDIDECALDNEIRVCPENAKCSNSMGGYSCNCEYTKNEKIFENLKF